MIEFSAGGSIARVTCDRCDRADHFDDLDAIRPNSLILRMMQEQWAIPVEGRPDLCPSCKIRASPLRA